MRCVHTNTSQAEEMYAALQAQGITPNTYILNAMLNVYAERGNAASAQDLYVQMTGMPGCAHTTW